MADINERDIEKYLVARVKARGGFTRKLKWIGRRGAPDRLVFLNGVYFVELKAPGKKLTEQQGREHRRMEINGAEVWVLDCKVDVDIFINTVDGYEHF